MSWWEQSINSVVRVGVNDGALDVPLGEYLEVPRGEHGKYWIVLSRKNGDCPKCMETNCCENNCCSCCGADVDTDNFEVRVQASGVTGEGCMRFKLPAELFERGKGRYEGVFVIPQKKDCETVDRMICKFVMLLDEFLCLDFNRAKTVAKNDDLLGGCDVNG